MSLLTERTKGHRRTDSTQSLSFEPLSPSSTPTLLSPQSLTPLSLSPFPSAFPSPEEVRRVSVTSPCLERRVSVWSSETPMLMERMDVAKEPAVKMRGEDLAHAYDAVRVANKFLESQLCNQRSQWEEELEALRCQLSQVISGSSSAAQQQADCSGDQTRARSICSAAVTAMKAALKKHSSDVDMTALWLKNACVLHDLLTQHSSKQTLDSDELVPLTTDLSDLIRALSDLCIQAYQQLLSITETRLQNIIVAALLESETIPGLSGAAVKLVTSRKRAGSDPRTVAGGDAPTMALVLRELGALHTALSRQDLPSTLMEQAFHQLTYLISASALNSLLLRKDMCCWSRGMQIRYNVSLLEEWLRSRGLQTGGAVATLEPLIQAVQLLQAGKKTEAEAILVQTCTALSSQQGLLKGRLTVSLHSS
ncbi:unconventional myosin-Va-like protein [Lates japonicus]|uniref:Unconventional myosin-Va-like protein n=1 Tax=Lates japonicus TaxID=270547 RepID=A0AAD3M9L5_LATJO|nr:unconventional myosin-Va-like protein [Lates japonicus]